MIRGCVFLSLAVACILAVCVHPSLGAEQKVTLREAITTAMERNHELQASRHNLSVQGEDTGIAKSFLLPRLVFEERFMRTNNPPNVFMAKLNQQRFTAADFGIDSLNTPSAVSDWQTSLSFEQPLFAPKAYLSLKVAEQEFSAKDAELTRKQEEIAYRVLETYLLVHTAGEYVRAARTSVEDAREHSRVAGLRFSAGVGLYSDTLRASTALAGAEQHYASAEKNLKVAQRGLGLLLGSSESFDVTGVPPEIPYRDLDYYYQASLARPDLKALTIRHDNAKRNAEIAQAGYLPTVGMGGAYQMNDQKKPFGSEGDSWTLMAFLRWELFDGTKREHEKAKAQFQVNAAAEYIEEMKKGIAFRVYEAYLAVEETSRHVELSRAALNTAEEGARLIRERYDNGLSPILDLLDSQSNLDRTRAGLVAASNGHLRAQARLCFESGTLLRDIGIKEVRQGQSTMPEGDKDR